MPEFYMIIARKIFFPIFCGEARVPPTPVSYTPMELRLESERNFIAASAHLLHGAVIPGWIAGPWIGVGVTKRAPTPANESE